MRDPIRVSAEMKGKQSIEGSRNNPNTGQYHFGQQAETRTQLFELDDLENSAFLGLPEELQLQILTQLSLTDLLIVKQTSKALMRLSDIAIADITKPQNIIKYLSQASGIEGNQFITVYQQTPRYKELKTKVANNDNSLTNEEKICYAIARDSSELPAGLVDAMEALDLDKQTRNHLGLIVEVTETQSKMPDKVLELFEANHPRNFVNILTGIQFNGAKLVARNLSYALLVNARFSNPYTNTDMSDINLRGANLTHARLEKCLLRNADLTHANLNHTNLKGADLTNAKLSGANLRNADLTLAQLINVDLRNVDLSDVNLEWTYLKNVRLVPVEAYESPEAMKHFLASFQTSIASHSKGSQRNLQEQLLHDVASQIASSNTMTKMAKEELLQTVLAQYNPKTMPSSIIFFENPCQTLLYGKPKKEEIVEHPLKNEFLKLINSILDDFDSPVAAIPARRNRRRGNVKPERTLNHLVLDNIKAINECLAKDPSLTSSSKICQAFGISASTWHLIFHLNNSPLSEPEQYPAIDYPYVAPSEGDAKKHYASEVFNGALFDVKSLQQIKREELDDYLYGDEDFAVIVQYGNHTVKLGDLLITYEPNGPGSMSLLVQAIDFENKQLKPYFNFDFQAKVSLMPEIYIPVMLFSKYSVPNPNTKPCHLREIEAGYAMKQRIIERVFATQKGPLPQLATTQQTIEEEALSGEKEADNKALVGYNRYTLHGKKQPKTPSSEAASTDPEKRNESVKSPKRSN